MRPESSQQSRDGVFRDWDCPQERLSPPLACLLPFVMDNWPGRWITSEPSTHSRVAWVLGSLSESGFCFLSQEPKGRLRGLLGRKQNQTQ